MTRLTVRPPSDSADKIKRIARQLFAERGVDGVTVRDIAEAAGQKNHAAVAYYFGSKDALVRELLVDGARLIDEKRNALLDDLEADPAKLNLRSVLEALVYSSIDFGEPEEVSGYNRFVFLLDMTHGEFFLDALEGRWNSGYLRCMEHLRGLMQHASELQKTQKLVFLGRYLGAVLSARESKLEDSSRPHPIWEDASTLGHLIDTMFAMLEA